MRRETLAELAADEPEIQAWLVEHREGLEKTLKTHWFDAKTLVLGLLHLGDANNGWRGYKDDIDRARCDVLSPFLQGQEVDLSELRTAVCLLAQSYNNQCDKIYYMQRVAAEARHRTPALPPHPDFRYRRPRAG